MTFKEWGEQRPIITHLADGRPVYTPTEADKIYAAWKAEREKLIMIIHLLLDSVDYTAGACTVTEMVGAVLPKEILQQSRAVLAEVKGKP